MTTPNYALYTIPAAWGVALSAHWVAIGLSRRPGFPKGRFDNSSPRAFLAEICAKPQKTKAEKQYIRAEGAQTNGFENLPLFAAAVVAGSLAKVDAGLMNKLSGTYVLLRVLYNAIYIALPPTEAVGALRTVTYLGSVGVVFNMFIKAAQKLNGA